ncbi:hypothetical protein GIY23_05965 [Allosaccharopolyspora coralli]|uniref:Family 43 glycosylhydrolase n=2 Tax=Allosaccharopolyspora coralli TaxID=2665642 RepID=A0A5Q3QBP8_9PSEU|nr:hypothetical protein GIY23_05965 [Allosaccharopolyspora coralli]
MVDGPMPRGLLGVGDPDVHRIDGRWTLFLGGFSTGFRNRLYRARLSDDGSLATGPWIVDHDGKNRVTALTADPPRDGWDAAGMHTPSYVPASGRHGPRIYYTGRATSKHYGPKSRYSIGVLEYRDGSWHRRNEPVLQGEAPRASVLEPFVIHTDGRYRMWYQANPHEIGPGEQPDYELRCVDSEDGLTDWSPPRVFADSSEGFFDNALARGRDGWVMVLARGSNLHGVRDFPGQGLWWITAPHPSADRGDWSEPRRLLDTDVSDTPNWCARGTYGPALAFADPESMHATVYVTGTRAAPRWPQLFLQRLARFRRPPVPAPFYLATGTLEVDLT